MVDPVEEQVAGVTLFFKKTTAGKNAADGTLSVELVLDCVIADEELWNEVIKRFVEGHRIYTSNSFFEEVQNVLRQELQSARSEATACKLELERLQRERAAEAAELQQYRETLGNFGRSVRGA